MGHINCELVPDEASAAVTRLRTMIDKGLYQKTTFCRMVPSFFIQGGCGPEGIPSDQKKIVYPPVGRHDKAGILSLAPDSNGAFGRQFIILERPAPWLDGSHIVLGQCGPLKTIRRLARVPTLAKARARRPITIMKMRIGRESEIKPVNGLAK